MVGFPSQGQGFAVCRRVDIPCRLLRQGAAFGEDLHVVDEAGELGAAAVHVGLARGVIGGDLRWDLIGLGAVIGVVIILLDAVLEKATGKKRGEIAAEAFADTVGVGSYRIDLHGLTLNVSKFLTQQKRWGLLKTHPDYAAVARQVNRIDIFKQAAAATGTTLPKSDMRTAKLIDGVVWDAKNPAAYADGFKLKA